MSATFIESILIIGEKTSNKTQRRILNRFVRLFPGVPPDPNQYG